ncbi:MAG TPA: FadR/GntR family transcriptional regulator [Smithellaceae bacterium]|nr:FadR/GntR family transcriptional regulator [Smithellaceae bacterium]
MLESLVEPIRTDSLKEIFVLRFEELILSGKIKIGEKLPPERELALQLGVSRPVVHEGLVELASRGLVSLRPRFGATVNDYRKEGSIALMASLIQYQKGKLEPELLESLLQIRMMLEPPFAKLAARNRTPEHLRELRAVLEKETTADRRSVQALTDLDFEFHLLIALASGNRVYPLLLNSFRSVYTNLSGQFFRNTKVTDAVLGYHGKMVNAVESGNETKAASVMKAILNHGEKHLRETIRQENLPRQPFNGR